MVTVEPQRILATSLPSLAPRRRAAWALSLVVHAAALGLGIWLLERAVTVAPPEPERMVYIEPAPPPPPPLGAPMNAPSAVTVPELVIEEPQDLPKAQRLVVLHKPKHVTPPPPVPAAVPKGEAEGEVGGMVGGAVGGEAGGKLGGVVGGHGDAPIPADQVEHPPVLVSRLLPVYPPMARARSVEGRVVLRAIVGRDGHVEEAIDVVDSQPTFDTAAIDALRQWRFEPGRDHDGKPVRVLIEIPIRFQLR